jgi:hypothetical protein
MQNDTSNKGVDNSSKLAWRGSGMHLDQVLEHMFDSLPDHRDSFRQSGKG